MGNKKAARAKRERQLLKGFDNAELLGQLLELASQMEISVRQEKGDFESASCRVDNEKLIFLKKTDTDSEKAKIIMRELAKFDYDHINVDLKIRDHMNQMRAEMNANRAAVKEEI
jgi:hypothetical protein